MLLTAFLIVCGIGVGLSTAQSPQKEEREIEDKIPKHLPIKVTVKYPEKVKNLQNENWLRDLEIEIENRSNKPIYFLLLVLDLPDVDTGDKSKIGFPLQYGRSDLVDLLVPLQSDDVPIKPGEIYTFRVSENHQLGWERYAARVGLAKSAPRKARLKFQILNFGDGTGFGTTGGVPIDIHAPRSSCAGYEKKEGFLSALYVPPDQSHNSLSQLATLFLPANFLPVNFLSAKMVEPVSSAPPIQSGICCPSTSCFYLKTTLGGNCFCEDELGEPAVEVHATACTDPAGQCGTQHTIQFTCSDGSSHPCTTYFLVSCQTPTPSPTPSATPTPCPSPTGADVRSYGIRAIKELDAQDE
jgi:hypothetical protein